MYMYIYIYTCIYNGIRYIMYVYTYYVGGPRSAARRRWSQSAARRRWRGGPNDNTDNDNNNNNNNNTNNNNNSNNINTNNNNKHKILIIMYHYNTHSKGASPRVAASRWASIERNTYRYCTI